MIKRAVLLVAALALAGCDGGANDEEALDRSAAPSPLRSGLSFLTEDTQALQADAFANPGHLWVDRGRNLFASAKDSSPACSLCHGDDGAQLVGASASYPAWDESSGELLNLEGRINACRQRHQSQPPLDYESEDLLALSAFVGHLSQGTEISVEVAAETQNAYDLGEDYFFTRRGQFNLSCAQCHNDNWGQQLRGDTISQGHGSGFPAYRLEWQTLGSLHRRFQDCDQGVRAEPMEMGSDIYIALEHYLAARASGLEVETPSVRR
ncbi:MAG: sulfur oxidation c-type cytochrome SoxA [Pseudomonadota bacterium]